ncbi:MAG: fasciclin domain-containing protein [Eubacteriales bacterium]
MSKKIFSIVLVVLIMMTSIMVYAEDDTVVDIAVNDGSFTTLVAALQEAELVETLSGEGPFTVFAPTDDAFAELLAALDITAEDLLNHPQLTDVLLYHVVSGKVMSTDLSEGMEATTLKGDDIMVSLEGGVFINDSEVVTADIEGSNGVIHVIDEVLVPEDFVLETEPEETVVDIAVNNGSFTTLVAALQKAELVEALSGEGPFTVFAPTDDAFAELLAALDITAEDLLNHPQLTDVLLYHVVSGNVMSTDLSEGMMPETLKGDTVMVSLEGGVFINDSEVVTADIEGSNGVIHVIDEVLVPGDFVLETEEEQEPVPIPDTGLGSGAIAYSVLAALGVSGMILTKKKIK